MHPNALTRAASSLLKTRLSLMDLMKNREVVYDGSLSAIGIRPGVTWDEYYEVSEIEPPEVRKIPGWDVISPVHHLFPSNGKMICPVFSLPAGPIQFGGTCVVTDALYEVRSVRYRTAAGQYAVAMIRPEHSEARLREIAKLGVGVQSKDEWVCNKCYALTGNFNLPSVHLKAYAVRRWVDEALDHGKLASYLVDSMNSHYKWLGGSIRLAKQKRKNLATSDVPHPSYFRIHDSGDFYRADYFEAWCEVAEAFHHVRFWASTRAYAVPSLWKQFMRFHVPKNLILRPSELFLHDRPHKADKEMKLAAGSEIETTKELKAGGRRPGNVYRCPATHSEFKQCQRAEGDYPGRDERNAELPWPSGCRFCWDKPNLPVSYGEH